MVRIAILYPKTADNWFNQDYYIHSHIPLVKKLFIPQGMIKCEVDSGLAGMNGTPPYFAITLMTFENIEQLQSAMANHSKVLMEDVPNYTRDYIVQIGEILNI